MLPWNDPPSWLERKVPVTSRCSQTCLWTILGIDRAHVFSLSMAKEWRKRVSGCSLLAWILFPASSDARGWARRIGPGGRQVNWNGQGPWCSAFSGREQLRLLWLGLIVLGCVLGCGQPVWGQENPLGQVHTPVPPPPPKAPLEVNPAVVGPEGERVASSRTARIRVEANLVLVPVTVTDPVGRLVTGLEKENFQIYDNNYSQTIKSFSTDDTPISIGVIFDLSGSMQSKFLRARKALTAFLRTCNPQDEFFVVGFNDRPAVIVDYTSDVDDVEARMVMLKPENRTALIDAIYLGVNKLRQAKNERKALLIISDGGDNRSRYTEGELRRVVRESDLQIYSIGIFDQYAPTQEEQMGPILLTDVCEMTGGRLFKVGDLGDLEDIASRISAELRNEYVIGYKPSEVKKDGNWRKLKVRLLAPPGLPQLTVHNRQGYYAPSQ